MSTYRKFGFTSQESFNSLMDAAGLRQEEEGVFSYVNCAVHEIGTVCIAQDAEGVCTAYDPRWAVDIIFYQEVPTEFLPFVVWPTPGSAVHWYGGWEGTYAVDFCANNPNDPFCTLAPPTE